jgi:hypothetical protein
MVGSAHRISDRSKTSENEGLFICPLTGWHAERQRN